MPSLNTTRTLRPVARLKKAHIALALMLSASFGFAQSTSPVETPTPSYRSVFSQYKAFDEQDVATWRKTNETVEKVGGWRVYAKEARQPDAAETQKPITDKPKPRDMDGAKP